MAKNKNSSTLVVGADSFIGSTFMEHLRRTGQTVVGTTRRMDAVDESHFHLDLAGDINSWLLPGPVSVAVVCSFVTHRVACELDPAGTALVNVDGVSTLIEKLVTAGAFVVFLSSDKVFDGSTPFRRPDEPYSPISEYGRQKAEVEHRIGRWGSSVAILRMNKVLGPEFPLFAEWKRALQQGECIRPISDWNFAPIPISCAISTLQGVCEMQLSGITQVTGAYDITYAEAARIGQETLGAGPDLVRPIKASESGQNDDLGGPHSTLNLDRLRTTLGIEPPDVRLTVATSFANQDALSETFPLGHAAVPSGNPSELNF